MRSRIAGTVAVAALVLTGGTAASAATEARIEVPQDVTLAGGRWVMDYELTDHALYMTTWATLPDGTGAARVWQRDLLPTAGGVAVGNARFVGTASIADWGSSIAADGDGIVYARATGGRELVRHADDGTETLLSTMGAQPVESATTGWYTSIDTLWPLPADRPGATGGLLTSRADDHDTLPWPALQTTSQTVASAVAPNIVVWQEDLTENGGPGSVSRVYANAIDANGFVGAPVLLAEGDFYSEPLPIAQVAASADVVAWATMDDQGRVTVSWVPATDLTAAPTVVPDAYLPALDGTHLSYVEWIHQDASERSAILDTTTGDEVASWPGEDVWLAESRGDLAIVGYDAAGDRATAALHSISGDTDVATVPQFDDVAFNPFATAIDQIALAGITTGYADGTFRGLASVNRDAMAAFLYRQAGSPAYTPPATSPFSDVPTTHPFYREIAWLADRGISTGWTTTGGEREFRPGTPVSREAMAAFLYRAAGEPAFTAPTSSPFTDISTGHPFYAEIAWLADTGISTGWVQGGSAQFRPGLSIERQAMAAFLDRFDRLPVD